MSEQRNPLTRRGGATPLQAALALGAVGVATYFIGRALVRQSRYFDLRGRVAIVTGGSRGLGLALARELVSRGALVAICARDERELRAAIEDLTGREVREGGDDAGVDEPQDLSPVFAGTCDVADPEQVARFVLQVREHFGRPVDVLVNNAGIVQVGPASHMKLRDYRDAMNVNYFGAVHFVTNLMPQMRQRRRGRIVNITSFGGKIPPPHLLPYAASKYAMVGFSETLRAELLEDGVYVTTVCPGLMRTGSPLNALFKGQQEKEFKWFATGDNLPIVSISPARMARQVIDAMQHGQAELISPAVARWQTKLFALMPGFATDVAGMINRLLPGRAPAGGDQNRPGHASDPGELGPYTKAKLESSAEEYKERED
jgi:NAD(P)-dependent dehydrogenase (short-subunit alcohol dehydrogenase family)